MELKDILTITISASALIASVAVAVGNYRLELERRRENARTAFSTAAAEVAKARLEREELRRELGDAFFDPKHAGARAALSDRRSQYVSRMLDAYRKNIRGASFEHLILAAALADTGRIGLAVVHYREAMNRATDEYGRAEALRVYGRAVYVGGERAQGRDLMREAADAFLGLSASADYEPGPMVAEAHETLRRLLVLELRSRPLDRAKALLNEMEALQADLEEPDRRKKALAETQELSARLAREEAAVAATASGMGVTAPNPPPGDPAGV